VEDGVEVAHVHGLTATGAGVEVLSLVFRLAADTLAKDALQLLAPSD
jgi:hypothetical protein